jgi:hypothetical protein
MEFEAPNKAISQDAHRPAATQWARWGSDSDPDRQARTAAEMSKATADWERVGDRFYRKTQLYTSVFDPELELENHVLVGAPLAGAVRRQANLDDNKDSTDSAR